MFFGSGAFFAICKKLTSLSAAMVIDFSMLPSGVIQMQYNGLLFTSYISIL